MGSVLGSSCPQVLRARPAPVSGALDSILVIKKRLPPDGMSYGIGSNLSVLLRRERDSPTPGPTVQGPRRNREVDDVAKLVLYDPILPVLRGGDQLLRQPNVAGPPVWGPVTMEGHPETAWGTEMWVLSNVPRQRQPHAQCLLSLSLAKLCEPTKSHLVTRRAERTREPRIIRPPTT